MKEEPVNESLLLRYLRKEVNFEEKKAVEEWLEADIANRKTLSEIAFIYQTRNYGTRVGKVDILGSYNRVTRRIRRKRYLEIMKYVVPVAATFLLILLFKFFSEPKVLPTCTLQTVTVKSNPGMRTVINLPDGSKVDLNSSSALTYTLPFNEEERNVYLEGEAYFDVYTDQNRPFVVNLVDSTKKVIARGTEFNIQAYQQEKMINTILVEGTVEFVSILLNGPQTKQILSPSDRMIYNKKTGSIIMDSVNTEFYTSWREGKLIFQETPLMDVLYRLSHYYDVKFEIANRKILTYSFTGTFENRQLSQVLQYLNISSGIKYEIVQTTEDDQAGIKRNKVILK